MDFEIETFEHIQSAQAIVPIQAFITYKNANLQGVQEYIMAKHQFDKDIQGNFILGDAKLMSIQEQHEVANVMLNKHHKDKGTALLDANLLAIYPDGIAWFVKAQTWTMRFTQSGTPQSYKIPMPPHVIVCKGSSISLYALKKNARPTNDTPLFISPVPNVYSSNNLCKGSIDFPKNPTQDHIQDIEQGIFTTINTHAHVQSLTNVKLGAQVKYLKSLENTKHFSVKNMIPINRTLKSII